MTGRTGNACVAAVVALASVGSAEAQERIEVSGGYQVTRVPNQVLPVGWSADIAGNLNDAWSIVGEAAGAYKKERNEDLEADVKLSIHTVGTGPRWSRRGEGIDLFAQLLTGVARVTAKANVLSTTIRGSATSFMLQPGAGMNVKVNQTFGMLAQADYRRVFRDEEEDIDSLNVMRIFVGCRFGF
jgi:Outer membrane protein beta-barrel domain